VAVDEGATGGSHLRQIGQSLPGAYVETTESPTKPRTA